MEWLANLSVKSVLVTAGLLLVLRSSLLHSRGSHALCAPACELIEASLAALVFVFLVVRPFVLQAYFIPSPSMHPTLLEADRILVDKLVYRFRPPRRGEILVFHPPADQASDDKDYIKRVIGLPGETIEVVPERLVVDGETLMRITREPASQVRGESFEPAAEVGFTYPIGTGSARLEDGVAVIVDALGQKLKAAAYGARDRIRCDERLVYLNDRLLLTSVFGRIRQFHNLTQWGGAPDLEGTVYSVNDIPRLVLVRGRRLDLDPGHVLVNGRRLAESYVAEPPAYAMPPFRIPAASYFMLGDNRNESQDSHYWGPLPASHIVGRADVIFWPTSRLRWLAAP